MLDHPRPIDVLERQLTVRAGKRVCQTMMTLYHDLRVLTPCPIPPTGGGILACNHTSSLDPVPLQAACPRLIIWMMAKEYYGHFGTTWFLDAIEPILVERSGRDMAATRMALRNLKDGKILGLFPEGRIETSRSLLDFQTGVALLAIKAKVPIYPAYLDGTQRGKGMMEACVAPQRITLAFGPPLMLDFKADGREALEQETERLKQAIGALAAIHP